MLPDDGAGSDILRAPSLRRAPSRDNASGTPGVLFLLIVLAVLVAEALALVFGERLTPVSVRESRGEWVSGACRVFTILVNRTPHPVRVSLIVQVPSENSIDQRPTSIRARLPFAMAAGETRVVATDLKNLRPGDRCEWPIFHALRPTLTGGPPSGPPR